MKKVSEFVLLLLLVICFNLISTLALCQPEDPPVSEVPIDGGLIWLILGGAGLGIRTIVKRKKKSQSE